MNGQTYKISVKVAKRALDSHRLFYYLFSVSVPLPLPSCPPWGMPRNCRSWKQLALAFAGYHQPEAMCPYIWFFLHQRQGGEMNKPKPLGLQCWFLCGRTKGCLLSGTLPFWLMDPFLKALRESASTPSDKRKFHHFKQTYFGLMNLHINPNAR